MATAALPSAQRNTPLRPRPRRSSRCAATAFWKGRSSAMTAIPLMAMAVPQPAPLNSPPHLLLFNPHFLRFLRFPLFPLRPPPSSSCHPPLRKGRGILLSGLRWGLSPSCFFSQSSFCCVCGRETRSDVIPFFSGSARKLPLKASGRVIQCNKVFP